MVLLMFFSNFSFFFFCSFLLFSSLLTPFLSSSLTFSPLLLSPLFSPLHSSSLSFSSLSLFHKAGNLAGLFSWAKRYLWPLTHTSHYFFVHFVLLLLIRYCSYEESWKISSNYMYFFNFRSFLRILDNY